MGFNVLGCRVDIISLGTNTLSTSTPEAFAWCSDNVSACQVHSLSRPEIAAR